MDQELSITHEKSPSGGRFVTVVDGQEAELTYRNAGDGTVTADHTGVPRALEGRGIGAALVKAQVADARANGYRITPLCSFVVAHFRRHPDWADVRA